MQKESEGVMFDLFNKLERCIICRHEYTSTHVEVLPGLSIHVCENCMESAKYNFIWICLNCGKVYRRPKAVVMNRLKDPALKEACVLWEHRQIIRGIDICIECDPQGILSFMNRESMVY
jgi:Fe2+ or Zn2+ uptake regulation protein